jgi:hypothetical protein
LTNLFNDKNWPMFFKNAFQAILLDYTTDYIVQQDLNLIAFYKQMEKIENKAN